MTNAAAQLQQLGFGKYESRAYVALLRRSPLNGYELAQQSGVPRANIYAVLRRLEERGAVVRIDSADGVRYVPVPPADLIRRINKNFGDTLDATQRTLDELAGPLEYESIANSRGYGPMLDHARTLLEAARERALLALWPAEARAIGGALADADARGVEVTTLCLNNCPQECGYCRGNIFRYPVLPSQQTRWLVLVADSAELLAGEIGADGEAQAVRTRQRLLVDLARWYIRHSIALAAVVNDLGDRFERMLQPETRAILEVVGPDGTDEGWLQQMRQLLKRGSVGGE